MIAFVKGELIDIAENSVVVCTNGIGCEISLGSRDLESLPGIGEEVSLYTYLSVNENTGLNLFGFLSKDDLSMFKLLITVSGIGPKGAQSILSGMSADALRFAILSEDVKSIAKAPGVGNKTAGKIVLELKDKVSLEDTLQNTLRKAEGKNSAVSEAKEEAVLALVSLGYSRSEALKAVSRVEIDENMGSDELLSRSLRYLG